MSWMWSPMALDRLLALRSMVSARRVVRRRQRLKVVSQKVNTTTRSVWVGRTSIGSSVHDIAATHTLSRLCENIMLKDTVGEKQELQNRSEATACKRMIFEIWLERLLSCVQSLRSCSVNSRTPSSANNVFTQSLPRRRTDLFATESQRYFTWQC
jgi:hypothetical protein